MEKKKQPYLILFGFLPPFLICNLLIVVYSVAVKPQYKILIREQIRDDLFHVLETMNISFSPEIGDSHTVKWICGDWVRPLEDSLESAKPARASATTITSEKDSLRFMFMNPGRHLISLSVTIFYSPSDSLVYQQKREIMVMDKPAIELEDSVQEIIGPDRAYVGEPVVFSARALGLKYWNWTIVSGKSRKDSLVRSGDNLGQIVHTFDSPGKKLILVNVGKSNFRVKEIKVDSIWKSLAEDPIPPDKKFECELKIKKYLQIIANMGSAEHRNFQRYKDSITYCATFGNDPNCKNRIPYVEVPSATEKNLQTLDNYCQFLHRLRTKNVPLLIETVQLEPDVEQNPCYSKIIVTESPSSKE